MISKGFEKVADNFNNLLQNEPRGSAAQVAIYFQGNLVADLSGGASGSPAVSPETPFLCYSVSKAFTAVAIMHLMERGRLELDAPIGRYWPEFAQRGKETATIRHALLHQAGIPAPHLQRQVFTWPFWGLVTRGVAREPAQFVPGSQSAYHLVNFGFILGEVVRRVSGLPVDVYLQRTFFGPLEMKNTWMRIPARELRRSPRLITQSDEMKKAAHIFNLTIIRRSLLPAAGLHSTAVELGRFFQMLLNGGEYAGKRYLQPETIDLAAQSHYDGYDAYIKSDINWGLGLIMGGGTHLPPEPRSWVMGYGSSEATFGALGMGTCMVWADRRARLVTAFTCNRMLGEPEVAHRWAAVSNSVWDCVSQVGLKISMS
jgi:CubicO group peptidase (beta-lactamase class C family)